MMTNKQFSQNLRQLRLQKALTRELDRRGLVVDRQFPAKLAAECLNQRT